MRKLIIYILSLSLNFSFAQTEQADYEIYSIIINDITKDWFNKPLNSILIVKQYKNKSKEDFSLINELTLDTISPFALDLLLRDYTLRKRFKNDQELKGVITDLISDFKNHPKIKTELLNLNNLKVKIITSKKNYSFHRRARKHKENGWKKIKEEYDTNLVFKLSKVKYKGNYACFYYSYHCGGLCASGNVVVMEKVNGVWKILNNFELWVS